MCPMKYDAILMYKKYLVSLLYLFVGLFNVLICLSYLPICLSYLLIHSSAHLILLHFTVFSLPAYVYEYECIGECECLRQKNVSE